MELPHINMMMINPPNIDDNEFHPLFFPFSREQMRSPKGRGAKILKCKFLGDEWNVVVWSSFARTGNSPSEDS